MSTDESWDEYERTHYNKQPQLDKYKASGKKLVHMNKDKRHGDSYEFLDGVVETDDVIKTKTTFFRDYGKGKVYMGKNVATEQKFLCVNGKHAGKKLTEKQAEGYTAFNRATRPWKKEGDIIPKVVLIDLKAVKGN